MNFSLQQLEYALAVAAHGNYTRAAEACHVSQPALSMQLARLEEALGTQLFDRSRQPVVPTVPGAVLLAQMRQTVDQARHLYALATQLPSDISGPFSLAVIPTVAPYLLPVALPALLEAFPQLQLQVAEMTTPQLLTALESGEVDMGILASDTWTDTQLAFAPLYREAFVVYLGKKHPLLANKELNREHLHHARMLLLKDGHCLRSQILSQCKMNEGLLLPYPAGLTVDASSLDTLIRLVDETGTLTLLPETALRGLASHQLARVRYLTDEAVTGRVVGCITRGTVIKPWHSRAIYQELAQKIPEGGKAIS